jgi:UDPglucose 6-dehydrogenase
MAELGHDVVGVEPDPARASALARGSVPFHEPGLEDLLVRHVRSGRLTFSTDGQDAVADVHFICVGTPQHGDGSADTSQVDAAVRSIAPLLRTGDVVVGKSTVPVGTAARFTDLVDGRGGHLLWNPEFLREGTAVADSLNPDRIVVGVDGDSRTGVEALAMLYQPLVASGSQWIECDLATAELAKVAANTFLAVKVSYANLLAELCDASGADVVSLRSILAADERIGGAFLGAGIGFGGGCLPKDLRGFAARAGELGVSSAVHLAEVIDTVNLRARARVVDVVAEALRHRGLPLAGSTVVVLGASFKPDSDDTRDSPALAVAQGLAAGGAAVLIVDPCAAATTRWPIQRDPLDALVGAHAVVLATDWKEYVEISPTTVARVMACPVAVDGRNRWDPHQWKLAGFTYRGLGRQ